MTHSPIDWFPDRQNLDIILNRPLHKAQSRFLDWQDRLKRQPHLGGGLLVEALGEMSALLEEIQVTGEELSEQHDTLIESRKTLEIERQRYLDLFEGSPDAYFITNLDGKIERVNQAAESMLWRDRASLIGKPIVNYISLDCRREFRTKLSHFARFGVHRLHDWDTLLQPKHTDPIPVSISVRSLEYGSDRPHLHWLMRNISDRLRQDQRIRLLESGLEAGFQQHIHRLQTTFEHVLTREVQHYVNNNLQIVKSLLSLQRHELEDGEASQALREAESRIRPIASAYREADRNFSSISLTNYLQMLIDEQTEIHGIDRDRIAIELDIEQTDVTINQAVALGLIFNELIPYTVECAFPNEQTGRIHICTRTRDDWLVLTMSDNGTSVPNYFDLEVANSLGMFVIRTLTQQLKGNLLVFPHPDTRFELSFPKPEEKVEGVRELRDRR